MMLMIRSSTTIATITPITMGIIGGLPSGIITGGGDVVGAGEVREEEEAAREWGTP